MELGYRSFLATALIIFIIGAFILVYAALHISKNPMALFKPSAVTVRDTNVEVRRANTPATRAKGLAGVTALLDTEGMWFIFDSPARQVFWMKDMLIPIDIIWVLDHTVVGVSKEVPLPAPGTPDALLPTYPSPGPVDHALEVSAGFARRHSLNIGDPVEFNP
ncbi:MAG: DUF192 domain-containing protein [Candidatus Sungbacteria bacterium]|uniref:DUF192 domain-containing protein n=1 Tax=Candidatus Sungiibacteriota bacterium TaxID=2750080 RepID=A0A9D6LNV4_9BACT|nr:DUF192 domain-containing protein [Candidatus Sungbacteria bacterium]